MDNYQNGTGDSGTKGSTSGVRSQLEHTQAAVNDVVNIMRVNVEKVLERDQKLSELDDRADALQMGAAQFEQQAGRLKRKYWWQNLKMMIIIGIIGVVLLAIIIISLTSGSSDDSSNSTNNAGN